MSFLDIVPKHIRQIKPYTPEKPIGEIGRELGVKAIQLGLNENPFGPSPKAIEAVRQCLENANRYPDDAGYYLREKLADHFKVAIDEIILGVGSSDILCMAYRAVLTPDSEVLTSDGSFIVYYQLAAEAGARLIRVPLRDYGFDLDAMTEQLSPQTRLIVIANPNNPTGTIIRRKEFEAFLERIPEHALLIMDEAYFEYVDAPEYPNSLDYLRSGKHILTLRTFSKVFGLAGLRIGYGIGNRDVIETLYRIRMPFSVSTPALVAGLAAWDDREHVAKSVKMNRSEMEFFAGELLNRGVKYVPSFTNFLLLDLGIRAREMAAGLLKQGVIVRAMAGWGVPAGLRVSIGTREQNVRFLRVLETVL